MPWLIYLGVAALGGGLVYLFTRKGESAQAQIQMDEVEDKDSGFAAVLSSIEEQAAQAKSTTGAIRETWGF